MEDASRYLVERGIPAYPYAPENRNMVGLDSALVAALSKEQAIGRTIVDVQTDFIYAPQYKIVLETLADDLWAELTAQLRGGRYTPGPLITAEVPKASGMTRPGSILQPVDRVLYQAIGDFIAPTLDAQLDNTRVFSYRIQNPDPNHDMFVARGDSYSRFTNALTQMAREAPDSWILNTDVTAYFTRINHHTLENLLTASGMPAGLVTLLVKSMLEAWSGRFSAGIPQGMFPSDLLGNYYLAALDAFLGSKNTPSARYVDDLCVFYLSEQAVRADLGALCKFMRSIGLDFNENKTEIVNARRLIHTQTEIDRLFDTARREVYEEILAERESTNPYGFMNPWEGGEDEPDEEEIESAALDKLWAERGNVGRNQQDKLVRFCLGAFGRIRSMTAVEETIGQLGTRPHLAQTFCAYLAQFVKEQSVRDALRRLVENDTRTYDWELQWPIAALLSLDTLPRPTVTAALRILQDTRRADELRALCAILVGKFGPGPDRTVLRGHWDSENSTHVRSAMLFSTLFFGPDERKVLLAHWGGQAPLYALVAKAVRTRI